MSAVVKISISIHSLWLDKIQEVDYPMRIGISFKHTVEFKESDLNNKYNNNKTHQYEMSAGLNIDRYQHIISYIETVLSSKQNLFVNANTANNQSQSPPSNIATLEKLYISTDTQTYLQVWCWSYEFRHLIRKALFNFVAKENCKNNIESN